MLEIVVRDKGALTVASYFRDGSLHQIIGYESWSDLLRKWTTVWSIDGSRLVRVVAAEAGGRHRIALVSLKHG